MTRLQPGQLRNGGSMPGRDKRLFSSPKCPDLLWGQRNLVFNRYRVKWLALVCDPSSPLSVEIKRVNLYIHTTHKPSWPPQSRLYFHFTLFSFSSSSSLRHLSYSSRAPGWRRYFVFILGREWTVRIDWINLMNVLYTEALAGVRRTSSFRRLLR